MRSASRHPEKRPLRAFPAPQSSVGRGVAVPGFTLIEVLVALAICAGSLVLLASVGNESLRRSLRARQAALLDEACRNTLSECACGAENAREGDLTDLPGWRWQVEVSSVPLEDLAGLERLTLRARNTGDTMPERRLSVLRYRAGRKP